MRLRCKQRFYIWVAVFSCVFVGISIADQPPDVSGDWEGMLRAGSVELRMVVHIAREAGGYWVTMDSPDQGATGIPTSNVKLDGQKSSFQVPSVGGAFECTYWQDPEVLKGVWKQAGNSLPLDLHRSKPSDDGDRIRQKYSAAERQRLSGKWLGKLNAGTTIRVVFNFLFDEEGRLDATLDSPDQGASGIRISEVLLQTTRLLVKVPAVGGKFDGTFADDGGTVSGHWEQGGNRLPLTLTRVDSVEKMRRSQTPGAPFPYKTESVYFKNSAAGIELAGTLSYPDSGQSFPAAVLISGSGPQNRDEEIMGHKPFLVLADHLTRRGIAVLRYDDRGVGDSAGDHSAATSVDFASDAAAAVAWLRRDSRIDAARVGLIGHSEGGLIAPIVAADDPQIAFVVLMAGPGVNGAEILKQQAALILRADGVGEAVIIRRQELLDGILRLLRVEVDNEKFMSDASQWIETFISDLDESERQAFAGIGITREQMKASLRELSTPWFRFFLTFEPAPVLQKVTCPLLAINGEKDLQVPADVNLAAIEAALKKGGNSRFTVRNMAGLNHLFQTADSGAPSEYARIEETFAPRALETISEWIRSTLAEGHRRSAQ